jgi:hypothetical protein
MHLVANHLDRVVEAALQDLTTFVYRDRLREAQGLDDPASRAGAIHLFKHLKHHGYAWDDEVVGLWAEAHAWTTADGATLAEYARGVREGVRYHTRPDPFGPHAIHRWRETAAERETGRS